MSYFPLYLKIKDKKILLIGGGKIALQKLKALLPFSKNITVIAPEIKYNNYLLIKEHNLPYFQRAYQKGDIEGFDIVIVASDDEKLQEAIFYESRGKNILVNCVDNIKFCDFIFPSIIKRGDITITISTNGASPALSKGLREFIESFLPEDLENFVTLLKQMRQELPKGNERMEKFKKVVEQYFKKKAHL